MSVVTLTASGQEPPVTHQEHIKCSLLSREDLKVLWEASYLLEGPNQKKSLGGDPQQEKRVFGQTVCSHFRPLIPAPGHRGRLGLLREL